MVQMVLNQAKPKHRKAQSFSNKGLFTTLCSFADLESRISALPDHERGSAFEVFAEAYFKTQALHQAKKSGLIVRYHKASDMSWDCLLRIWG